MNSFDIGKTTGSVEHYTVKGPKKDGTCPVKFRITHQRKAIFIGSGYDLTEEAFSRLFRLNPKTKKKHKLTADESKTKKLITAQFERIKNYIEEIHQVEEYSHGKLRIKLKRGRGAYVDTAFENKVRQLTEYGRVGNAANYNTARNFFGKYSNNLRFVDITPLWLEKFEHWALTIEKVKETTLSIYLRTLRALFNEAIRNGEIPKGAYPFDSKEKTGYKIPKGEGTKIALSIEKIRQLAELKLKGSKQRCRDMFLLSFYLGGINFKDLLNLKWKNIINGEVHFIREKTRNTIRNRRNIIVPLVDPAKKIIEKRGNPNKSPDAYVINHLDDSMSAGKARESIMSFTRQVNKQLKEIGKYEEIQIEGLSSMVARHSFATILKNSGSPIAFIGEILGHTSTKTTETYLKSFESEQRKKQFDVIANIGKAQKGNRNNE
jgi:integrase